MQDLMINNTMTLKEITDLLKVDHSKAMARVSKMSEDSTFGWVAKTASQYESFGQPTEISYVVKRSTGNITIQTYQLDKRQSIAVASKLNVGEVK